MGALFALVLFGLALLCVLWWRHSANRLPYPPGPKPLPLLGNIHQLPKVSPWATYAKWGKKYGDVLSVGAFGNRIVIVNSARAASELFDKRGTIYSDRPHNVMMDDLIGYTGISSMNYTETFRLHSKLLNVALNPTAVTDYTRIQEKETYGLLARLLNSPEDFYQQTRRTAGAIILMIAYGHAVTSDDDYFVRLAEAALNCLRYALQPDSFLVNLIPALKYVPAWMPFAGFQRFGREGRELSYNLCEMPFAKVKSDMLKGVAPFSYTSKLLEANGTITNRDDEEELIKVSASVLYGAGSDTTLLSIMTFVLAMALHPEVQKKAQAELDAVVGNSRLPTVADRSSLPYLECVLSEVLRWQPVAGLGVPHAVKQDDIYKGCLIPKGCVVMGNIWGILHDEELYDDPMRFWPERFDGRFPDIKDPRLFVFGFGRRLCPGRHLAMNTVFIAMACMLSTYNINKARGPDGREIEIPVDDSLSPPAPFECQIAPRSQEAVALIRATEAAYEA